MTHITLIITAKVSGSVLFQKNKTLLEVFYHQVSFGRQWWWFQTRIIRHIHQLINHTYIRTRCLKVNKCLFFNKSIWLSIESVFLYKSLSCRYHKKPFLIKFIRDTYLPKSATEFVVSPKTTLCLNITYMYLRKSRFLLGKNTLTLYT